MKFEEFKQKYYEEEERRKQAEERRKERIQQGIEENDLKGGVLRFPVTATHSEKDDEEDDYDEDIERNLLLAQSLLTTAMHHLGFYGDPRLATGGKITRSDQQIMLTTAEEIRVFLEELENYGLSANDIND